MINHGRGIMKYLVAVVLATLGLAASAQASVSELSSPNVGSCIGRTFTALGQASYPGPVDSFRWSLQSTYSGGTNWAQITEGTNQITGSNGRAPIATFSTVVPYIPSPADFRLVVTYKPTGGTEQVAVSNTQWGVVINKTTPAPPSHLTVRAVSAEQAWVTWDIGSAGPGCAGTPQDSPTLWTTLHPVAPGTGNGAVQTNRQDALITGLGMSQRNRLQAYAEDTAGNRSDESQVLPVDTRSDTKTVLAGKVTNISTSPHGLFGINVTAKDANGVVVGQTMTNADGWYNLALVGFGRTYTVQYGPGCGFYFCAQGYQPQTRTITLPNDRDVYGYGIALNG